MQYINKFITNFEILTIQYVFFLTEEDKASKRVSGIQNLVQQKERSNLRHKFGRIVHRWLLYILLEYRSLHLEHIIKSNILAIAVVARHATSRQKK